MEPIEPNFHQYEIKEFFNLIVSTSFNSVQFLFLNFTNRLISRMLAFLHFGSAIGTESFSKVIYPLFHQVLPRNLDLGGLYLKNKQKNYFSY